jgi:hypothetical protein
MKISWLPQNWGAHGGCAPSRSRGAVPGGRSLLPSPIDRYSSSRTPACNLMKTLLLGFVAVIVAGCGSLSTAGTDRVICASEPTDQVERQAARELCR